MHMIDTIAQDGKVTGSELKGDEDKTLMRKGKERKKIRTRWPRD